MKPGAVIAGPSTSQKRWIEQKSLTEQSNSKRLDFGQTKSNYQETAIRTVEHAAQSQSQSNPQPLLVSAKKRALENADVSCSKRIATGSSKTPSNQELRTEGASIATPSQVASTSTSNKGCPSLFSTQVWGPATLSCVSCGDTFSCFNVAKMQCGHNYCRDCLQTLLKNSLNDEGLFPPRCCKQTFLMDDMRRLLSPALISTYGEKKVEFETQDRTYCFQSSCSAFLYPDNISEQDKVGICAICLISTCTLCKGQEHGGKDCPRDSEVLKVLELAKSQGWRRCNKCCRVIELRVRAKALPFASLNISRSS